MATVKKGMLVPAPQWWKHLKDYKKHFWGRQRNAEKSDIRKQLKQMENKND